MVEVDPLATLENIQSNLTKIGRYLEEEEKRYKAVCEFALDGIWDWHIDEGVIIYSDRFWEILGHDPKDMGRDAKEWQKYIHPEDLPPTLVNLNKHVETKGQHPYLQKVRYIHKLGHTIWILCQGRVISWFEDQPIRMIGTHLEVSPNT